MSVLIGLLFAFGLTRSNEGPPELPDVPIQAAPGGPSAEAALPAAKENEAKGGRAQVGSGALLRVVVGARRAGGARSGWGQSKGTE